jgi:hypothetical protein
MNRIFYPKKSLRIAIFFVLEILALLVILSGVAQLNHGFWPILR